MDVLRNCYDPEIPVNIVDLGLVYGVAIDNDTVKVRMTLTAMGCPASAYLSHQVKELIEKIPGVTHADVDISVSDARDLDRKSTRLNSSHRCISYAVFCLKKKIKIKLKIQ